MTVTSPSDNLNALPKLKTSFPRCRPLLQTPQAHRGCCSSSRARYDRDRKFSVNPPLSSVRYNIYIGGRVCCAYIVSCFQIGNFVAFTFQVHPRLKMPSSDFWHLHFRMLKYPRNFKASRSLSTCFHSGNVAFSLHPSVTFDFLWITFLSFSVSHFCDFCFDRLLWTNALNEIYHGSSSLSYIASETVKTQMENRSGNVDLVKRKPIDLPEREASRRCFEAAETREMKRSE